MVNKIIIQKSNKNRSKMPSHGGMEAVKRFIYCCTSILPFMESSVFCMWLHTSPRAVVWNKLAHLTFCILLLCVLVLQDKIVGQCVMFWISLPAS